MSSWKQVKKDFVKKKQVVEDQLKDINSNQIVGYSALKSFLNNNLKNFKAKSLNLTTNVIAMIGWTLPLVAVSFMVYTVFNPLLRFLNPLY